MDNGIANLSVRETGGYVNDQKLDRLGALFIVNNFD